MTAGNGKPRKAEQACELWAQTYPRDPRPHGLLSLVHGSLGKYERAAEESMRSIELDPDFTPGYANLAFSYLSLNRLKDAEDAVRRASERVGDT